IYSKPVIEEIAPQCGLVLVMEPATPSGALKTWRKGIADYEVTVKGRASHAGNAPEQGINAVVEMAQQTLKLNSFNDYKNGTSVSVTVVKGGIATNVIPEHAEAKVDVRTMTNAAFDEINARIIHLEPFLPGAEVQVNLHHARGPMERNAKMIANFNQAKAIGEKIGLSIYEDGSGGASDGNFTAYLGVSTLDGMGAQGEGLHAVHEHVVVNSLPKQAALIAAMLKDWVFVD
ncbi:MAG: M20/M25/M40 family metallo-hydrolase, partial [Anaerolineae bacterium]|nr:M20/M25/M40 family metallo-hydrolase [Anaerolineae bacterium]